MIHLAPSQRHRFIHRFRSALSPDYGIILLSIARHRPGIAVESADRAFDRQWAHALLARALDQLAIKMDAEGRRDQFENLKPCLLGQSDPTPQAELASRLGANETAVKVAIHRLRKRFREFVRAEIAETLTDRGLVDEEMRHLIAALRSD